MEQHDKLLARKVHGVETHFSTLSSLLDDVLRTEAKLTDRWEALATAMENYAEEETPGVKDALADYADMVKAIQRHRRAMYEQADHRVLRVLQSYPAKVKSLKDEIANRDRLRVKEATRKKNHDRLKARDPMNDSFIAKSKVELSTAKSEVKLAEQTLVKSVYEFEQEKIEHLREMLQDLLEAQLVLMCRGLEELSTGQESIDIINADEDLSDIRAVLEATVDTAAVGGAASAAADKDEPRETKRKAAKRRQGRPTSDDSDEGEESSKV